MIHTTITCDQCPAQKQEANHWFLVDAGSNVSLTINKWDEGKAKDRPYYKHLCGQECLQKFIEKWARTA